MIDPEQLLFGPYSPPRVKVGDLIFCEIRGLVVVHAWSKGRIPWPVGRRGGGEKGPNAIILCDDLVRAVQNEASITIQHWWGVSEPVVTRWRKALGVGPITSGTHTLRSAAASERLDHLQQMTRKSSSFEAVARRQLLADERGYYRSNSRPWSPEHVALLGKMRDRDVGQIVGHSSNVVAKVRRKLGIAPFTIRGIAAGNAGNVVPLSHDKLRERRIAMGLTQRQFAERAGLAPDQVAAYEHLDGRFVDRDMLNTLADRLECPPSDLVQDGWDLNNPPRCRVDRHGIPLTAEQAHPLRYGPYSKPEVQVGDRIICVFRGEQTVKKFSQAPIPWPIAEGPGNSYIVFGDLARAVRNESIHAVKYWWGVQADTIYRWRRKLNLEGHYQEANHKLRQEPSHVRHPTGSHQRSGAVSRPQT